METPLAAGTYIDWWVVSISLTNLLVVAGMLVLFVLALVVPFPHPRPATSSEQDES